MGLGRREAKQTEMWVAATMLPLSPEHGFYEKRQSTLESSREQPGLDRHTLGSRWRSTPTVGAMPAPEGRRSVANAAATASTVPRTRGRS